MREKWVFFIGPGKTGSSWLYANLRSHTEIRLPENIKESNYFLDKQLQKKSIKDLFFDYDEEKNVNLDISNTYIYKKEVANEIYKFNPESKIIIGYRDPFERVISAFSFKQKIGLIEESETLYNCLFKNKYDLIHDNRLFDLTKPYLEIFDKSNIFIFEFKKIKDSPRELLLELFNFIGVKPEIDEGLLLKKINPSSSFRFKYLSKFSYKFSRFLRKKRFHYLLNFIKTNLWVQKILYKPRTKVISNKKELTRVLSILKSKRILEEDVKFRREFNIKK